jgi:hypothetical protein
VSAGSAGAEQISGKAFTPDVNGGEEKTYGGAETRRRTKIYRGLSRIRKSKNFTADLHTNRNWGIGKSGDREIGTSEKQNLIMEERGSEEIARRYFSSAPSVPLRFKGFSCLIAAMTCDAGDHGDSSIV